MTVRRHGRTRRAVRRATPAPRRGSSVMNVLPALSATPCPPRVRRSRSRRVPATRYFCSGRPEIACAIFAPAAARSAWSPARRRHGRRECRTPGSCTRGPAYRAPRSGCTVRVSRIAERTVAGLAGELRRIEPVALARAHPAVARDVTVSGSSATVRLETTGARPRSACGACRRSAWRQPRSPPRSRSDSACRIGEQALQVPCARSSAP